MLDGLARRWRGFGIFCNELAIHLSGALLVIASMWLIKVAARLLFPETNNVFFQGLPLIEIHVDWLFDAIDIGILLNFGWHTVGAFRKALNYESK